MVTSSKGKRELLVDHYRKLETPTTNKTFDTELNKEIDAWAEANVDTSKYVRKGIQWLRRVTESAQGKK